MIKRIFRFFLGRTIVRYQGPKKGVVALTFDDGPTVWTTPILETLKKHDAKATFFVLGHRAEQHRPIIQNINKNGNQLGNHSWFHKDISQISLSELKEEIDSVDSFLYAITKRKLAYRPPYGILSFKLFGYLMFQKRRATLWSRIVGGDEKNDIVSKTQIENDLKKNPICDGDIILLHDTNEATSDAIPAILDHINRQGLKAVTLQEMLS